MRAPSVHTSRLMAVLLLALLAIAAVPRDAGAKRVRMFAVGPKFDLAWVGSPTTFRGKLLALMDASKRPGAPAVQPSVGDVASHLLGPADRSRPVETARDLVTLPEDIGLMAAFAFDRGRTARAAPDLMTAIAGLIGAYAPVSGYYLARFPELASRPAPPTRLLAVSLTDTFVRVGVETFAALADAYDVWLEAGVTLVRDWRVVCMSKATMPQLPGGVTCDVEDPRRVLQLRAPDDSARPYAYEATSATPSTMALVFDPDGRLVSKQVKSYLTPVELPGQLDLMPGAISTALPALQTPVGRLGFVTSKDAWMPDVTRKLDQAGVEILVQPEFFVNDTVRTTGMWAPDTLKSSGYSDVLRHPSIAAMVLPQLVGNVYDFSADSQQAIVLKPGSALRTPVGSFVGQRSAPGFATVAPWVVRDPIAPGEPMAARRERLGKAGEALLPGGPPCPDPARPGACEGGQVESVLFADVQVADPPRLRRQPRRPAQAPFTSNKALAPGRRPQRNVALAARGSRVLAAYEERRGSRWAVALSRSTDHGATWSRMPRPVVGRRARRAQEWWPSLAAGPGREMWLAWQDDSTGVPRVYVARSADGGRRFGRGVPVDAAPAADVHQWKPAIAAAGRGEAVVAWIDERERSRDDGLPQASVRAARVVRNVPGPSQRLDAGSPATLAAKLDNSWWPSVAARGAGVLVSWIDFRGYDWDVYSRLSRDGGRTFADQQQVNDTPDSVEALDDAPASALLSTGEPLVAYTSWQKDDRSARAEHPLYDVVVARPGGEPVQVDGHGDKQLNAFNPAIAPLPGGEALVAWQGHPRGHGDVAVARVSQSRAGRAVRVDDSGRAGWNQWRPAIAVTPLRAVVAWEDDRDGPSQIYVARARPRAIR